MRRLGLLQRQVRRVVRKPLSEGSQQSLGKSELEGRLPVGLQRGIQVIGATRNVNYPATYPTFRLREGTDEFVIGYGVN